MIRDQLLDAARDLGFELSCSAKTGSLLRVLAACKPKGRILELGTGVGVGTSYLAEGLASSASLVTVEIDERVQNVARQFLGGHSNITFVPGDAAGFLVNCEEQFDLIFADTWAGKFTHLDEAMACLKLGGLYVIDDLSPQPTWPEGHAPKVPLLIESLNALDFLTGLELDWDTGLAVYVRIRS